MIMRKDFLLALLTLIALTLISGCAQQNTEATGQEGTAVKCTDASCFQPQFLACNPSEMKMPFMGGTNYIITVVGLENGKCHYYFQILDNEGKLPTGMQITDCIVPKEKITADTFGHFFGQDSGPGSEAVKAEQDKIQADYCTKQ